MSDCRQCADFDWCTEHEDCGLFKPKPQTNADRIRAMSDEELAELWWERVDCGECPVHKECKLTGQDCKRLALDWLKRGVDYGQAP